MIILANNWWSLVLRGVVAILLGLITFVWPGITFGALVILFGAYALLDGIFAIIGAWRASRAHERWGALVLEGVAGLIAAAITILWPAITALALVFVIAAWALVTGVLEIVAAVKLRKQVSGEWLLALAGVVSIIFAAMLVIFPLEGALAIALIVGIYAVIFGVLLIALGFRLRGLVKAMNGDWSRAVPSH